MSAPLAIAVAIVLLFANGFFVGAEFALVSARRSAVEIHATEGSAVARITLRAMDRVTTMMAGAQLGITLCSLGLGAVGEPAVAAALEPLMALVGIPETLVHPISFVIAMVIVVYLHMVVGEMVPKNMAIASPDRAAMVLGPPMYVIAWWILRPLLWLMNAMANLVLRMLRVQPTEDVASTVTADQARVYLQESHAEGLLEENEHRLMSGAITLSDETAADEMLPLDTLAVLPPTATVADAEAACVEHGFSRFPVAEDDRFVGYVHVKDLLDVPDSELDRPITEDVHDLVTVDSDTSLQHVLATMQREGAHLALVTEGGVVIGVVMLEDVVERMIGKVSDNDPA